MLPLSFRLSWGYALVLKIAQLLDARLSLEFASKKSGAGEGGLPSRQSVDLTADDFNFSKFGERSAVGGGGNR